MHSSLSIICWEKSEVLTVGVKTFAAIDVGSYELSMKIFEVSQRKKIREIDHIRHRIELGTETYNTVKLNFRRS